MKKNKIIEQIAKITFFVCALASVASIAVIMFFIFSKGLPAIKQIGIINFLGGKKWEPQSESFGIFPMLASSVVVTAVAFVFGSAIGRWTAIFLAYNCPKKLYKPLKSATQLLAGIPSVIYGFFGVVVVVPLIRASFGGPGKSMLAAIIILTIMILPTIINLCETSLKAVPISYYEGAVALGATHNEAVFKVVVPAAKSGISAAYILGIGRALGETMAIILVAGNNPRMPTNVLMPIRTLTTGIAMEMGYASALHQSALFGIGVVLFVIILLLNVALNVVLNKKAN